MGDGGRKNHHDTPQDHKFNPKESVLHKATTRGNTQRRLLLKNGEVNISRYAMNFDLGQLVIQKDLYLFFLCWFILQLNQLV